MRAPRRAAVNLIGLAATLSGLSRYLRWRRHGRSDYRVLILEYHDVSNGAAEPEGTISAVRFRRHLRYLKRHYRLVSLAESVRLLADPSGLAEDCAVITFDDGYAGTLEGAWPVLKEEAVPATVFVTTGFVDGNELWFDVCRRGLEELRASRRRLPTPLAELTRFQNVSRFNVEAVVSRLKYLPNADRLRAIESLRAVGGKLAPAAEALTWDQVRRLDAEGCEIGGHTVTHPILSTLDPMEQKREIVGSRDRIAEELGRAPELFAFPNGSSRDFTPDTLRVLRESGFSAACTTVRGSNRPGCDPFQLHRIGVGADSLAVLAGRLAEVFSVAERRLSATRALLSG